MSEHFCGLKLDSPLGFQKIVPVGFQPTTVAVQTTLSFAGTDEQVAAGPSLLETIPNTMKY